jgi:hypothetical protein
MDKRNFYKSKNTEVAVSKWLLSGLVAALVLALFALVFFIGRESARKDPPPLASRTEMLTDQPDTLRFEHAGSEQEPEVSDPEAPFASTAPAMVNETSTQPSQSEPEVQPEPETTPQDPSREAVRTYFETIAIIQPNQMSGDASVLANELVAALTIGDSSGLDNLIRQSESIKSKLEALTPPPPCYKHHQMLLAGIEDGLELMQSLKNALNNSDMEELTAIAAKGSLLRTHSEALTREENTLRQRYGL